MITPPALALTDLYPAATLLLQNLTSLIEARDGKPTGLTLVERVPVMGSQTYPSEVVTCTAAGVVHRLFCKYGTREPGAHRQFGHRHGTAYEGDVYRTVLQPLRAGVAGYWGTVEAPGATWLVLDYLPDSERISRVGIPGALSEATRWIGAFHRETVPHANSSIGAQLHRYTADYYMGWADRTTAFSHALDRHASWLSAATRHYEAVAIPMLLDRPAIIHGEFYSGNVLHHAGRAVPVDWESAAIGAPEIDLACFTERWPESESASLVAAYVQARWGGKPPSEFSQRLSAARLYLQFRWLGDREDWTVSPTTQWRFDALHQHAAQLGLREPQ